ncbi:MAG: hypothetical protein WDA59_00260 [Methanofastidiosum sp.]|jgi:hypothetical protein
MGRKCGLCSFLVFGDNKTKCFLYSIERDLNQDGCSDFMVLSFLDARERISKILKYCADNKVCVCINM